jgi:hypothetical protein
VAGVNRTANPRNGSSDGLLPPLIRGVQAFIRNLQFLKLKVFRQKLTFLDLRSRPPAEMGEGKGGGGRRVSESQGLNLRYFFITGGFICLKS